MTFLSIRQLGKRYGATQALANVNLDVAAGTRTAIVGPSGSGKTTLLRIVAGFEMPDTGSIELDGIPLVSVDNFLPAHQRDIGIVSQEGALFPHLNVFDNIGFGLDRKAADYESLVLDLLDTVELPRNMRNRRPHELSGGQQQRVALARALARKPKLILLDEPFSSLDTGLRENMRKAVARVLKTARITALLVTHDQAEALSFADQVAVMRDGNLVQVGTPTDLYFHPRERQTATFLGDAIILTADVQNGAADTALGRVSCHETVSGRFDIMLRPEQIKIIGPESWPVEKADTSCEAVVVERDFRGSTCAVAIQLTGTPTEGFGNPMLSVTTSSLETLSVGTKVHVEIAGKAHILQP